MLPLLATNFACIFMQSDAVCGHRHKSHVRFALRKIKTRQKRDMTHFKSLAQENSAKRCWRPHPIDFDINTIRGGVDIDKLLFEGIEGSIRFRFRYDWRGRCQYDSRDGTRKQEGGARFEGGMEQEKIEDRSRFEGSMSRRIDSPPEPTTFRRAF